MCIKFDSEFNICGFRSFLAEVNYGALEKDVRINDISKQIKENIVYRITNRKLYGSISLEIATRSKNPNLKTYTVEWSIKLSKKKNVKQLAGGGKIVPKNETTFEITINLNVNKEDSTAIIVDKIIKYTKSQINETLNHEIKHMLDMIDGNFKHNNYFNKATTFRDKQKYISQDKEIQSYFISLLSDIEHLKKENPELNFNDAKHKSSVYDVFMKYILPSKRKKYLTKLAHFWYSKYITN